MQKSLPILLLLFLAYYSQAQECFVGKSQKFIMDSLAKIKYTRFDGQVALGGTVTSSGEAAPRGQYIMNFSYDLIQDTVTMNKMKSSQALVMEQDTINTTHYSFLFDHDGTCLSSMIYYPNLKDYQKVITELNSNYKVESKDKVWIDLSGQIEVVITRHKYTPDFDVNYHKLKR